VALGAVGSKLSAVNVGVAIGALLSNVGENRLSVASRAGYLFVHAAKGVSRAVVAKFRNGANRGPARACMAIFARNVQRAVRTSARLPLGVRRAAEREGKNTEREPNSDFGNSRNGCLPIL
jgi:hypothetical protein